MQQKINCKREGLFGRHAYGHPEVLCDDGVHMHSVRVSCTIQEELEQEGRRRWMTILTAKRNTRLLLPVGSAALIGLQFMRMIITTLVLNVKAAGSFLAVAIMTQKKMIILRCEVQDG